MAGSITFDSYPAPDDSEPVPILVARYDKEPGDFSALENVRCVQIQYKEGAHPPTAQFEYVFQDDIETPWPSQFEDVWPLYKITSQYVVQNDDRLVVFGLTQNGDRRVLFHGFAQVPQVDLGDQKHAVTFVAIGVAIRLWDKPIQGSFGRDASNPYSTDAPVFTCLAPHFNPNIRGKTQPNCTPDGHDCGPIGTSQVHYPVFLDWRINRAPDPDPRTLWDLGKLVRYLSANYNDETEVLNIDLDKADNDLQAYEPKNGAIINPLDDTTFTRKKVIIRDYNAQNNKLPDILDEHLGYAGFSFFFACDTGPITGKPSDSIKIFRKDAADTRKPKNLSLSKFNATFTPGDSNIAEMRIACDFNAIANAFAVETALIRYEISVVLAPDFVPSASDESIAWGATESNIFLRSNLQDADAATRAKYRRYVFDEAGDGHWDGSMYVTGHDTAASLDNVLKQDPMVKMGNASEPRQGMVFYVSRNRPPLQTLLTVDGNNRPRRATLEYSTDFAANSSNCPGLSDGSGTWKPVDGGWELLKDRIGIQVNVENPEEWTVGQGDQIRGISAQANPDTANPRFYLRLTCVIESDQDLGVFVDRRVASPTKFTVKHQVDAKDHFRGDVVDKTSRFSGGGDKVVRNDYEAAKAHATLLRTAHEFPPVSGSVSIPYLTNTYEIGDKIGIIDGRDVSLQTNASSEGGEAPVYPSIVSKTWVLGRDKQYTVLQLSDRREEPVRARLA